MNRSEDLARRILLGEDAALELKSVEVAGGRVKNLSRKDFADELAAFANTRGGTVILGVDDKTRKVTGIPLDSLDVVEGWVREICDDSVTPSLDADIYKLDLQGTGRRGCTRHSYRDFPQPLRAPKPGRILSPPRQLEARNVPGGSVAPF